MAKKELIQVEKPECELRCQQARIVWATYGDRNSKFFHAVITERKRRNKIQLRQDDGAVITSATEIGHKAVEFFTDLFMASPYYLEEDLFVNINPKISESNNYVFFTIPSNEEILDAIKYMNPSSSPGNDGFTSHFYSSCLDIIQDDICAFIRDFFQGAYVPKGITSTTLILIPKSQEANQLKDFWPISLSNFSGKIISKILAIRLARLLPKIVDEEQAGFVQGRNISTPIVLAQELIRYLNKKVLGGNVIFKLDMTKAYDHLEWRFLLRGMKVFGFSDQAMDLIYRSICDIWYTLRINGEYTGNFRSFRGVRQGDLLSPLLFVLAEQILSTNVKRAIQQTTITPYSIGRKDHPISHLFYADDVLVFTNGSARSLNNFM